MFRKKELERILKPDKEKLATNNTDTKRVNELMHLKFLQAAKEHP